MTTRLPTLLLVLVAAALAPACSPTFTITRTRAELQQSLAKRFPVTREKLMVGVTLSNPSVILRAGERRIGVELDAEVRTPLGAPVRGRVAALGEPFYDKDQKTFFIRSPVIERLDVAGLGSAHASVREALGVLVERALGDVPVYHLEGRNSKEQAAELLLKDVAVRDEKLYLTLGPP